MPPNGEYPPAPKEPLTKALAEFFHNQLWTGYATWIEVDDILRTFSMTKYVPESQYRVFSGTYGSLHIAIYMSDDEIIRVEKHFERIGS